MPQVENVTPIWNECAPIRLHIQLLALVNLPASFMLCLIIVLIIRVVVFIVLLPGLVVLPGRPGLAWQREGINVRNMIAG